MIICSGFFIQITKIIKIIDIFPMYQNIENLQPPEPAKCAKVIRIINIATGATIAAFGIVGIIFMAINSLLSFKFFLVFSPVFIILFGLTLLAVEFKQAFILENFGFLKTLLGRGIFNIYLSTQIYYYFSCGGASNEVLAWVFSMVIFGIGILYVVLHCTVGKEYTDQLKQQMV